MKKSKRFPLITLFILSICLFPSNIWSAADIDSEELEVNKITPVLKPDAAAGPESKPTPFSFSSSFDGVAKAKIRKPKFHKGEKLEFAVAEIEGGFVFYYDPAYSEGANTALTYSITKIRWDENLHINQSIFHTVSLSFGAFSKRLDNWLWRAQVAANADSPGKQFTGAYVNYDILLWGRYEYNRCIGIHAGFLLQTGMRMDKGWPIFGFDWQISRKWKLNAVYPVNMALNYSITNHWITGAAIRVFNTRHRIKRNECHARYLVRYENVGTEFFIKYEAPNIEYNVHVGNTWGGRYRIADPNNNHPHTSKFDGAAYIGAEADIRF